MSILPFLSYPPCNLDCEILDHLLLIQFHFLLTTTRLPSSFLIALCKQHHLRRGTMCFQETGENGKETKNRKPKTVTSRGKWGRSYTRSKMKVLNKQST